MKVYLAGPMRGIPKFNHPAFHAAAEKLREDGHEVFSPAEADVRKYGKSIADNPTGSETFASANHGFNLREALGDDLGWICSTADAIALLPGWERSKGANAEKATAEALGLHVIYLEQGLIYLEQGQ